MALTIDLSPAIAAVDAAILQLQTDIVAGTVKLGLQSMSVAGRNISYNNVAEALQKLVALKMELESLQAISDGSFSRFSRGRVTGLGV